VTDDLDGLRFNTAIAQLMVLVNELTPLERRPRMVVEALVLMLSPFAPHLGEELWRRLGHAESLAYEPWPVWDAARALEESVTIAVQINGKLRATLEMPRDVAQAEAHEAALADERVRRYVDGGQIRKVIFVPNKLLNLVVGGSGGKGP